MNNDKNIIDPPTENAADALYDIASALIGYLPIPYADLFAKIFKLTIHKPFTKRKHNWEKLVVEAIQDLQKRTISIETISENEQLTTILIKATIAALQTHQEEKHLALKNCFINSATGIDINDDLQLIFVRLINDLTLSHITLFRFLSNNEKTLHQIDSYRFLFDKYLNSNMQPMEQDEFKMLIQDLSQHNLLKISSSVSDFSDI